RTDSTCPRRLLAPYARVSEASIPGSAGSLTMCGIVGAVVRRGRLTESDLRSAVGTLSHRGPDGSRVGKVGSTAEWDVWFGHARLSIVDLSEGGNQPMTLRTVG